MIYQVIVGKESRKQRFSKYVDFIVEFDGNYGELLEMMQKKYFGFRVYVNTINKIEKVESTLHKQPNNEGFTPISKHYNGGDIFAKNIPIKIADYVESETLKKFDEINMELTKIKNQIEDKIKESLNDRVEVLSVYNVKLDTYKFAHVDLKLNGDIYTNKN